MDELFLVPADFYTILIQKVNEPLEPVVDLSGESQQVAVLFEVIFKRVESVIDALLTVLVFIKRIAGLTPSISILEFRFGTNEEPNLINMLQSVSQRVEPVWVEVSGDDIEIRLFGEFCVEIVEILIDRRRHSVAISVVDERRLLSHLLRPPLSRPRD